VTVHANKAHFTGGYFLECRRAVRVMRVKVKPGTIKKYRYSVVLVQRELDKFLLRLREYLAFGKEVFLGMREFWITVSRKCAGRPI